MQGGRSAVEEFSADLIVPLQEPLLRERGFAVTTLQLDVAGVCRGCRDEGIAV